MCENERKDNVYEVIRVKKLELLDGDENVRARLECTESGDRVGLVLFDQVSNVRLSLGVTEGKTDLTLEHSKAIRMTFDIEATGIVVTMKNLWGTRRVTLCENHGLIVKDKAGNVVFKEP